MSNTTLSDELETLADLCDRLSTSTRRQHLSRVRAAVIGIGVTAGLGLGFTAAGAIADASREAPSTPATEIHGLPANNPGFGGDDNTGASPAGLDAGGVVHDGGLHNIAGVRANGTGQPNDRPPACTAHGGLGLVNDNC